MGKTINVRVSFEDDAGNEESLTSAATATAAARPSLTASVLNAPQSHNGSDDFTFELRFSEEPKEDFSYKTLKDHAFTVTGGEVDGARRLVSGQQHSLGDNRHPGFQQRRDRQAARHQGLQRRKGPSAPRTAGCCPSRWRSPSTDRASSEQQEEAGRYERTTQAMPRQRTRYSRIIYVIPDNFPQRLRRFKEESGLSWSEIARRIGTLPPHRVALVEGRGAAQPTSHESASGPGRRLWPQLHIHRLRRRDRRVKNADRAKCMHCRG